MDLGTKKIVGSSQLLKHLLTVLIMVIQVILLPVLLLEQVMGLIPGRVITIMHLLLIQVGILQEHNGDHWLTL